MRLVETPLDKLSNRALDAIEAGQYHQAETRCRKLLRKYPKALDGHDRMAQLRLAQGRFREAVNHYDKLLEMAQKDTEQADPETIQYITEQRDEARAQIEA
jgi:tetratricopeptide (TPR) repeat protein